MKNKALFYILSFTWGLPMTLIGLIFAAVLICAGYTPKRWGKCLCFNVGRKWGGLSLGIVMITDQRDSTSTKNHEYGHAVQNCHYGLFMPILSLASVIRYWERKFWRKIGLENKTAYDDFWFEGQATEYGKKYGVNG